MRDELEELNNDKYISKSETEKKKKENEKEIIKQTKKDKQKLQFDLLEEKIKNKKEESENKKIKESENYTEIYGSKLEQINTINKYKLLFPTELADFTYNKKSNSEQLAIIIEEIKTIVELQTVDSFLTNSIYDAIQSLEPYTKPTAYDISGISNILRTNPNVDKLLKQIILKHNLAGNTSPELQLLIIVITSTYMVIQQNKIKKREEINQYLNQKI